MMGAYKVLSGDMHVKQACMYLTWLRESGASDLYLSLSVVLRFPVQCFGKLTFTTFLNLLKFVTVVCANYCIAPSEVSQCLCIQIGILDQILLRV
jgi:hypothetical protein